MTHLLIDFLVALPFVVSFAVIVAAAIYYWHAQRAKRSSADPHMQQPR